MKKLINLLGIGILSLAGCATTNSCLVEDVNSILAMNKLGIPKKFENYKNQKMNFAGVVEIYGHIFYAKHYDINNDGKPDVGELYGVFGFFGKGDVITTAKPIYYGFDFNLDNKMDSSEMLFDENSDGLNGNEEWVVQSKISTSI